jgi:HK97 gp10 family phage protein
MAKSSVKGYRETAKAIRRLSDVRRPITESSRYALKPILDASKANLRVSKSNRYEPGPNVVTGTLLKSMAIRQKKASRLEQVMVVAATGKGIKYAHLVEFGTDPHWQPKRRQWHPGAQPFPFLTPAFMQNDKDALNRFGQMIGKAIEAHANRVRARR